MVLRHVTLDNHLIKMRSFIGNDKSDRKVLIRNLDIEKILKDHLYHLRTPAPRKGHG